ncbi:MAG: 50S ribosomal protein L23 [Limnochordia bacterium]|jgi:large subunit ribosomal protein L23|nr:50S ribosomal protein L23 [Limnochordia bacterium]MDD2629757.1 50S ribosomal protein L23 [Limnochordia bacterium]MDD4517092.1 50S ribosomal protein L23 [Limnochordia bacterium]
MELRNVIIRPVVSEKSTLLREQNKYVFEVDRRANKTQIRQAVEALFDVEVENINTLNVPGKLVRRGRTEGYTKAWKKAIVKLSPGSTIDIFESL